MTTYFRSLPLVASGIGFYIIINESACIGLAKKGRYIEYLFKSKETLGYCRNC